MFHNLKITDYLICHNGKLPPMSAVGGFQYVLAGNGLFIQAENRHWQTIFPIAPCIVRGLPEITAQLVCRHGKLPSSLLQAMIANGRQAHDKQGKLVEAMYRVRYQQQAWSIRKPAQNATSVTVNTAEIPDTSVAVEMHTHGEWSAHFSATDNADEQGLNVFGVIGRLQKPQVELCLRVGVYGYFHPVALTSVFTAVPQDVVDLYQEKGCHEQHKPAPLF